MRKSSLLGMMLVALTISIVIGAASVTVTALDVRRSPPKLPIRQSVDAMGSGEGYILSKSSDFTTNDRDYDHSDTIYIKVWSGRVDYNNLKVAYCELIQGAYEHKFDLTSLGDGSYTGSFVLSGLEAGGEWNVHIYIKSQYRGPPVVYEANDLIQVSGGPSPPPPPDNKWAVVIGIADYEGRQYDLWHPDEDAKEMAKALTDVYGFSDEHIILLLNKKATYTAIMKAISWLKLQEDSDSTVVFFFSGHGFRALDTEGWDTIDDEVDGYDEGVVSYDFIGISDGTLAEEFAGFQSTNIMLWFGSCHSGGMEDLIDDGRVICCACEDNEYAYDYLTLGNTLFGYFYVDEGMLDGLGDVNADGIVTVEEAFQYAQAGVESVRTDSHPVMYDCDLVADFYL